MLWDENRASLTVKRKSAGRDEAICEDGGAAGLASRAYVYGAAVVRRQAGEHLFKFQPIAPIADLVGSLEQACSPRLNRVRRGGMYCPL